MVELPKHVHRIVKRKTDGKETAYTFFTKFRNTSAAWPSIQLPEPPTAEFLPRMAICDNLDRDARGFLLDGKRLPDHKDASFWAEAEKAQEALIRRGREGVKDFKALVEAFQSESNPFLTELSASTRRSYKARPGKSLFEGWDDDLPSELTTVDAEEAIDAPGETPATANQFRAFLSRLMAWGRTLLRLTVSAHHDRESTNQAPAALPPDENKKSA